MTNLLAQTHGYEISNPALAIVMLIISAACLCFVIGSVICRRKGNPKKRVLDFDNEEHLGI